MPNAIVDIYCRTATSEESSTFLDEQEAAGRQYCLENGLTVGAVYKEVFSGNQYQGRPRLEAMRRRYRRGKIQGVVVYRFDRLSRSTTHLAILMQEMEKYHTTLYAVRGWADDTLASRFLLMLNDFLTDVERERALDNLLAE